MLIPIDISTIQNVNTVISSHSVDHFWMLWTNSDILHVLITVYFTSTNDGYHNITRICFIDYEFNFLSCNSENFGSNLSSFKSSTKKPRFKNPTATQNQWYPIGGMSGCCSVFWVQALAGQLKKSAPTRSLTGATTILSILCTITICLACHGRALGSVLWCVFCHFSDVSYPSWILKWQVWFARSRAGIDTSPWKRSSISAF